MNELGGAIVSITLVMMSVFIPVSFMSGTAVHSIASSVWRWLSRSVCLHWTPWRWVRLCVQCSWSRTKKGMKKSTFVSRFHSSFNAAYDSLLNSYKKRVVFFIQKKWLSFGIVAGCIVLLVVLMNATPTGMVPNEIFIINSFVSISYFKPNLLNLMLLNSIILYIYATMLILPRYNNKGPYGILSQSHPSNQS